MNQSSLISVSPTTVTDSFKKKATRGFTLVEVLIVIALIGVLTAVLLSTDIFSQFFTGQEDTAQLWVDATGTKAIESYYLQARKYPKSLDDLLLPAKVGGKPIISRKSSLLDPWGQQYQYKHPGTQNTGGFDLWTITPDGKKIGNWDGS